MNRPMTKEWIPTQTPLTSRLRRNLRSANDDTTSALPALNTISTKAILKIALNSVSLNAMEKDTPRYLIGTIMRRGAKLGTNTCATSFFVIDFASNPIIGSNAEKATNKGDKDIISGKTNWTNAQILSVRKIFMRVASPRITRFAEIEKPIPPNRAIVCERGVSISSPVTVANVSAEMTHPTKASKK